VADRASGRFKDFSVSPISNSKVILAYLASTFIISLVITTVTFVLSELYLVLTGGSLLTIQNAFLTYCILVLLCAVFSAISSFIVTFIKSLAAFSSFNVIVGTAAGFLAAVYVPVGTLPKAVDNFINLLPFSQAASLVRGPFVQQPLDKVVGGNSEVLAKINDFYGFTLRVGDYSLSSGLIIAILVALFLIFTFGAIVRMNKKLN
jgi:multidrug/hemolysin transport system permease protein